MTCFLFAADSNPDTSLASLKFSFAVARPLGFSKKRALSGLLIFEKTNSIQLHFSRPLEPVERQPPALQLA